MNDSTQFSDKPERDMAKVHHLMEAHKQFMENGQSTFRCDDCGGIIAFIKLSDQVESSSCSCGKYNSSLKGF